MNRDRMVRLGITLGDPRGIGPEVTTRAAQKLASSGVTLLLIGPRGTEADQLDLPFESVGDWQPEQSAAEAGLLVGKAIERGSALALEGAIDGLVTAPIDKSALHAGGYRFPGHTEMLAHLSGVAEAVMLMCAERTDLGGALRVVLATTHLPLRDVPAAFTTDLLVRQARITAAALRADWGIERPRLALCAFNPHASDGGLFGNEEAEIYGPARAALLEGDLDVTGPVPADTVFVRALRGEFDAVVAPYHDVGMAAFKTAAFGRGVNVTLGLPFVRTSPDHGTALDIAGLGQADAASMIEAVQLAQRFALRRATTSFTR